MVCTMAKAESYGNTFLTKVKAVQVVDIYKIIWCSHLMRNPSPNRFRVGAVVTASVPLPKTLHTQRALHGKLTGLAFPGSAFSRIGMPGAFRKNTYFTCFGTPPVQLIILAHTRRQP